MTGAEPPAAEPLADEGAPALGVVTGLPLPEPAEPSAQLASPEAAGQTASRSEVERLNRLACAAAAAKDYAGAIRGFEEAVALAPTSWMLHYNLGAACLSASRHDEAEASLRQALALNRQCIPAWMHLAHLLSQQGRCRDALAAYDRVVELEPDNVAAVNNAGLMLRQLGRYNAAKVTFARAVALAPDNPRTRFNHAMLDDTAASRREALADCRRCLEEDPRSPALLSNLGVCHQLTGEFDAALAMFGQAIAADPDFDEASFNRSLLRLGLGDFAAGWREYERRWQLPQAEKLEFAAPVWDGGPLDGRTILLYAEQGFGDALQFLRYVPQVAARGGRIVLRVHRALVRLAASLPGEIAIVTPGNRLPDFDVWCPLLSLPRLFETRLESIPAEVPYLRVRPALAERWRSRLADLNGLRVGLAWAGDPRHINDFRRSIALDRLAPLIRLAGISWVSLQTGEHAVDLAAFAAASVRDLSPELNDFAETAGVIGNLDLVIAVDTAVAHLAGALAAPVWTLLPFSPDWRWMFGRRDSPWYPTMRLFRQPAPGDWETVVAAVCEALAELRGRAAPVRRHPKRLRREPDLAEAHHRLGEELRKQGDLDAAIERWEQAVAMRPDFVEAHRALALSQQQRGRLAVAADCYRRALALGPDHAETLGNFGVLLMRLGRLDDAIARFEHALACDPRSAAAHCNLGVARLGQNRIAAAIATCDRALALQPNFVDAAWNRGLAQLAAGDFTNGWDGYERRWDRPHHKPRELPQPLWQGEDLAGRTILVYHEQGFGDTIQFLRYVPLLAAQGARVVVEVQPALVPLATSIHGAAQFVAAGDELPQFDLHCPLMSLPHRCGTSLATIPAAAPYLAADPTAASRWRSALGDAPGLKVGIAWAGNAAHRNDRQRSIAVEGLLPLLRLPHLRWFSLQVGERAGDLARLPLGLVADLSPRLSDFAESAAVVANLDLIITVDTAVAHLAGALGRPAWVMLAFAADWRWLIDRADSPWYPSLRLFRQKAPGDWPQVMAEVRRELAALTGAPLPLDEPSPPLPLAPPGFDAQAAHDVAMAHYSARRIERAAAAAREILAHEASHAGACHLLGLVALHEKRHDAAADLLRRAVALDPGLARAHNNLGIALAALGRRDEAIAALRRAVAGDPRLDDAHCNLGLLLRDAHRLDEAADCLRRAIARNPAHAEAHRNLGRILKEQGRLEAAITSYREAAAARPDDAAAASELGVALHAAGRLNEAADSFRHALALRPDDAAAHTNLGNVLSEQGRLDEAADCHSKAISARPDFADAHANLGQVRQLQGHVADALDCYRRCLRVQPDHVHAHLNLALAQLLLGEFEAGWREYEWRWRIRPLRRFARPLWGGEDPAGKTILVHHEQGFGDTIQFLRYVPLLAARGARVIVEVPAALARLAATAPGTAQIVVAGAAPPAFDLHCPLASLPERFATRLDTIPAAVPYLSADAEAVARWRRELGDGTGRRVGLAWAGNPRHQLDRQRSIAFERLQPLFDEPGISWFSLQVGEHAGDPARLGSAPVADLSSRLSDFAETAAALANLDLVVAIDTAIVHLAGALGRPTWVMLPFAPDWRWQLGRTDSPWYPSLRLFRQPRPGDWDSVIGEIRGALRDSCRTGQTGRHGSR